MKHILSTALLLFSGVTLAQENVKTNRVTHLLHEPNQATFDHNLTIAEDQTVTLTGYHDGYFIVQHNSEDYLIYYPYFNHIENINTIKAAIATVLYVEHHEQTADGDRTTPSQTSTQSRKSSSSSHYIHTGPRGGRYYINKNGNKTYIKKKH